MHSSRLSDLTDRIVCGAILGVENGEIWQKSAFFAVFS